MRGSPLCSQRRGVEGLDGQPDAEGHCLSERYGNWRACAAPPQALCSRPPEYYPVCWVPGRGTRGAAMVAGAEHIKIHGQYVPVRAAVRTLDMLSAHADADEIMRWLKGFRKAPCMAFVTHGEPTASDTLRHRPKASPQEVRVHDFIDPDLGRAVPYGIYDIADNKGWVVLAEPSSAWTWAWITIPRRPRSMRSAAGGARWDRPAIHEPGG